MKRLTLVLFLLLISFSAFAQTNTPPTLSPEQVVRRDIKLKETQIFEFSLDAGEFVRFEIEQKNVDPQLVISAADGKFLREMYFENIAGKTAISFIADEKAMFLLTLKSSGKSKTNGDYRLQMSKPRPANDIDRRKIAAEKILTENGLKIENTKKRAEKPTNEQRQKRLAELQKLAAEWQTLDEPVFEQKTWFQIGLTANHLRNIALQQTAFEKLLSLAQTNKEVLGEAWALYWFDRLAVERETAQKNFIPAAELAEKSGAKVVEAEIYNRLAIFYRSRAQLAKAREAIQKIIKINSGLKDEVAEAKARMSLANLSDNDEKTNFQISQEALKIFEQNDAFYEKAVALGFLGSEAADNSKFEAAEKYFNESLWRRKKSATKPKTKVFKRLPAVRSAEFIIFRAIIRKPSLFLKKR